MGATVKHSKVESCSETNLIPEKSAFDVNADVRPIRIAIGIRLIDASTLNLGFKFESVSYRATKLFNMLKTCGVIPHNILDLPFSKISHLYHNWKDLYILQNRELIKHIFDF